MSSMADQMQGELRKLRADLLKERERAESLSGALQEEAERRQAAEESLRRPAEKAKTAAAKAIAEWGARQALGVPQTTLAETVMAAIDAALKSKE